VTFEAEQLGDSGTELASLLRELRKRAGLSGDRLAARCNMSQSKVSRIESGKSRPSLVDVEQILRALDAPPSIVGEVAALARLANTEWRNLRELRRKGLGTRQAELKSLEASSTHMRYFLLSMVTGLLATPEYVRASLAHSTADTSKAVAGKLERQAILYDVSKQFTFILTEQAVRWPVVSPLALAEQMDRLSSLTYSAKPAEYVHRLRRFIGHHRDIGREPRTPRRPRRAELPRRVRSVRGMCGVR
jgi:transcriptional regulator with XRE-family HTH domain